MTWEDAKLFLKMTARQIQFETTGGGQSGMLSSYHYLQKQESFPFFA